MDTGSDLICNEKMSENIVDIQSQIICANDLFLLIAWRWDEKVPFEILLTLPVAHNYLIRSETYLWFGLDQIKVFKLSASFLGKHSFLESRLAYTNSLVNADLFYANFTNTTFQKIPIDTEHGVAPSVAGHANYIVI